jgi:hypothetical protein
MIVAQKEFFFGRTLHVAQGSNLKPLVLETSILPIELATHGVEGQKMASNSSTICATA